MAWTGIASILLPGGATSHKIFKLPLDMKNTENLIIKSDFDKKKIRECDVILWDESSMVPKKAFELVDKLIRDICNSDDIFFGNKLLILGGDYMQTLPVIKYGTKEIIINETLKFSEYWEKFKIFKLTKNMRNSDKIFSSFLLKIGNGSVKSFEIPELWKTDDICSNIYGDIISPEEDLSDKIILSSHNEDIYKINNKILDKIKSNRVIYYSIDNAKCKGLDNTESNIELKYPVEYLNSLVFPGFPVHKLVLKVNAIVMLIRNLSVN